MFVYKELTSLTQKDVFVILNSEKIGFDYPIHYHSSFELTLILHSAGNRIVGDSVEKYKSVDLVLIGPEIYHKWDDEDMPVEKKNQAHVITIQFSNDLFNQYLFSKDSFFHIQKLLKNSKRGLVFTDETTKEVSMKMKKLVKSQGFNATIQFLEILHILSISKNKRQLAGEELASMIEDEKSDRINRMYKFILANSKDSKLRITDLAIECNMSPSAFGHFFKKCTNKSFTQFLVSLRLSIASTLLLSSNFSISEIAYKAGFNSMSNFNRLFKKNKFLTPKNYRLHMRKHSSAFNANQQLTANQFG